MEMREVTRRIWVKLYVNESAGLFRTYCPSSVLHATSLEFVPKGLDLRYEDQHEWKTKVGGYFITNFESQIRASEEDFGENESHLTGSELAPSQQTESR